MRYLAGIVLIWVGCNYRQYKAIHQLNVWRWEVTKYATAFLWTLFNLATAIGSVQ